ncbi:VOC family protein [Rhodohalobacter sulfatireducens]|uniref:VOC family protein n=1 Tax=Rhodohalobacter sulfatireducens TaxID=2911366 RepID=A0ABS9KHG4_9BACT|nr:VOC family protein [Rhodohalobacter sulfatireducens]MCG2590283.1 VOC family protein [Rhodohalobacter sulfatireducens]
MKISGILETCLYAEDLEKAKSFYSALPGIEFLSEEPGRHIFFRCAGSMLLIFNPNHTSKEQTEVEDQPIPLHGSHGDGHIAFSIDESNLDKWKQFLIDNQIPIESEVTWPNGSVSIYFRDPSGNSLELVSPNIWG